VGGKIYVSRLIDVKTETSVYSLDGKPAGAVSTTASALHPRWTGGLRTGMDTSQFQSYFFRLRFTRLDTVTGKRDIFFQPKIPFDSANRDQQVFFKSKDGTGFPCLSPAKRAAAGRHRTAADDRLTGASR